MSEENVDAAAVSPRPQSASDTSPAKDDVIESGETRISITPLTIHVTKAHLEEIFGSFGALKDVFLPRSGPNLRNQQIAFLDFESPSDAEKAKDYLNGGQIDGQYIRIAWAPRVMRSSRKNRRSPSPQRRPSHNQSSRRSRSPVARRRSRSPVRRHRSPVRRGRSRSPIHTYRRRSRSRSRDNYRPPARFSRPQFNNRRRSVSQRRRNSPPRRRSYRSRSPSRSKRGRRSRSRTRSRSYSRRRRSSSSRSSRSRSTDSRSSFSSRSSYTSDSSTSTRSSSPRRRRRSPSSDSSRSSSRSRSRKR